MIDVGTMVRSKTNRCLIGTVAEVIDSENVMIEIPATKSRRIKILSKMEYWELAEKRLTEHTENSYRLKDCPKDCIRICNECDLLKRAIRRLGELEDIEHGILKKIRDFKE